MFFTGGAVSFARRFRYLFPTYEARHGEETLEVPIVMVALVATALYATLYEWHHGDQQVGELLTNAYLDVYLGHVNTLKHIQENRNGAFHLMMADIYTQAKMFIIKVSTPLPQHSTLFDQHSFNLNAEVLHQNKWIKRADETTETVFMKLSFSTHTVPIIEISPQLIDSWDNKAVAQA
ncbi:hypothetical protein V8E53_005011 [Lactarius tabidus]